MIERLTLTLSPTSPQPKPLPRCGTKIEMLRVYETIYSLSAWLKLDCALTMVRCSKLLVLTMVTLQ